MGDNLFIIFIVALIEGALGGLIYMFARDKLRARWRRLHREEMERKE